MKMIKSIGIYLLLVVLAMCLTSAGEPIEHKQLTKKEAQKIKKNERQQYRLKQRLPKLKKKKKYAQLEDKIERLEQEHKELTDGQAKVGIGLGISSIALVVAAIITVIVLASIGGLGGLVIGFILLAISFAIAFGLALAALLIGIKYGSKPARTLGIVGLSISIPLILLCIIVMLLFT